MNCPFYTALTPMSGGRGLFANQYFPAGTVLLKIADQNGNVVGDGKWINSGYMPNTIARRGPDGLYAVASMPIYQGREIIGNYFCN